MVSSRRQRQLGQNFLVDPNILDVIERLAEVGPEEVVLEVGGGLGVLSERLARRARHLHVVEVDPGLEQALREVLNPFDNVTLHMGDAVDLDLPTLEPPPQAMVANLPYSVAATVILRTIEELPTVTRWLVMVQRQVGERLAAGPRTRGYGATSVLAQLACEVRVVRQVPRTVFRPVPHVDSVLVGLKRTGPAPGRELRDLVHEAFAHRRKTLAGSLELGPSKYARERVRRALQDMGHPPDERAERLSAQEFRELAVRLQ